MASVLTAVVSMLIVLGIMVLVHEFGHFAVAKLCGVRVEVFSVGFGKRLFGFRRGDTDYRLSLLPLGGYVKMSGELQGVPSTDEPAAERINDPGDLAAHPRWQRVLIVLAGPVANFILAFALMAGLYMMHNEVENFQAGPAVVGFVSQNSAAARAGLEAGDVIARFDQDVNPTWEQVKVRADLDANSQAPITVQRTVNGAAQRFRTQLFLADPSKGQNFEIESLGLLPREQDGPLKVMDVMSGSAAQRAGLRAGDAIVSIDGVKLHSVHEVMALLQQTQGKQVTLVIERGAQTLTMAATPNWGESGAGGMSYQLGFYAAPPPFHVEQLPLSEAIRESARTNLHYSGYIIDTLRRLVQRPSNVQQMSGPIGIARVTGEAVSMPGWQPLIGTMALISLNLGILNLLPVPLMDGGTILFLAIEGTLRRDLNQQFKERISQVAFVALILFAAFIMFNDVAKLHILPKLKP
jgi:regulator of sigma E protease